MVEKIKVANGEASKKSKKKSEVAFSVSTLCQNSTSKNHQIFWLILFAVSFPIAIYQTVALAQEYFKYHVGEIQELLFENTPPAITLCVNSPIGIDYKADYAQRQEAIDKIKNLDYGCKNVWPPSLFCLSLLSAKERFYAGYFSSEFILSIDKLYQTGTTTTSFNNLYYGNCFIINYRHIGVDLSVRGQIRKSLLNQTEPSIIAIVNELDTPPVFNPKNILKLTADAEMHIHYSKQKHEKKPWPFESDCVAETDDQFKSWPIVTYSPYFQSYGYTRESCLDQCIHNLTIQYCQCIIPWSLLDRNVDALPICKSSVCKKIPQHELNSCNCRYPCKYTDYKVAVSMQRNYPNNIYNSFINFQLSEEETRMRYEGSRTQTNYDKSLTITNFNQYRNDNNRQIEAKLQVLLNPLTEIITEKELMTWHELLDNIGGIWGLWIGISILAVVELLGSLKNKQEVKPSQSKNEQELSVISQVMKRFSLSTISKTNASKYKTINLIWTLVIAAGFGASAWQTYCTVTEYLKYEVVARINYIQQDPAIFPSVVVCSHTIFYLSEEMRVDPRYNEVNQFVKTTGLSISDRVHKKKLPIAYKNSLSEDNKLLVTPKIEDFVLECEYKLSNGYRYDCKEKLQGLTIKDKSCAVFNPRLLTSNKSDEINPDELFLKVESIRSVVVPLDEGHVSVGIHPPGAPFLVKDDEIVELNPGDFVDAKFSTTVYNRLPLPYVSNCIDPELEEALWMMNFYDPEANLTYRYTFDACLISCLQNWTIFDLQCSVPYITKDVGRRKDISDAHFKDCALDVKGMADVFLRENNCGCRPACKSVSYDFEWDKSQFVYKKFENITQFNTLGQALKLFQTGPSAIRIKSKSQFVRYVDEKPRIGSQSLVGLIGGGFGLWVGASVVSLIEAICLFGLILGIKFGQYVKSELNEVKTSTLTPSA
ncbi:hypothetical protein CHUAL_008017 [Chamberlinius hualienensis]